MNNSLSNINEIDRTDVAVSFKCQSNKLASVITIQASDLTVISQNIRSIYANLDDLRLNLCNFNFETDVIILTECQLDSNKNVPQIENYTSFHTTKHVNKADGVVAFIKNTHKASVKEIILNHASGLQIVIDNVIIIGTYRSPSIGNADEFIHSLNLYLDTIKRCKNVILTGDINISLIYNPDEASQGRSNRFNYLNMLATHGMLPGHILPTRGRNCLDHFIIKLCGANKSATIAVLDTTITDHAMIFLKLCSVKSTHLNINKKVKKVINYDRAIEYLKSENLNDLLTQADPNLITQGLITILQKCLALNTQTITVPGTKRIIKPWMTAGVLRCIRNRNDMQSKLRFDIENKTLKVTYKRYRNFCNKIIKKLKRDYDRMRLENAMKNPKKLWSTINNITQRKPPKSQNLELLDTASTPQESLDKINAYFATIGKQLAENIPAPNYMDAGVTLSPVTSFALMNTDSLEVYSVLMSMKSDSAPGWDKIPTHFLKVACNQIIPIIVHLTNKCFESGVFPIALKQTIITPVHKSGDKTDPSNFRPISVISVIAKILEKLINIRLLSFFSKNDTFSGSQYGFRKKLSTEDAVLALTSAIVENVDAGKKCLAVFLDLKKAFDTVSIPILLRNLHDVGIRGDPLKLLESYLTDRISRVGVGSTLSSECTVNYGVPQGSVLGPTLFLVYINKLCNMQLDGGRIFSYADDTAIVFTAGNWEHLKSRAEVGLARVADWLNIHLLSLNLQKTNYICFTKYNNSQPLLDFKIVVHRCDQNSTMTCSCTELEKIASTKYLGVMLDQRLSWHCHIELLMNRTRKLIWTFKVLRHVTSEHLLRLTYISLAQSVLSYCLTVWGGANKTRFLDLERAQRTLLKVMYYKPRDFSTELLYSSSDLLSVRKLYVLNTVLSKHKSLPYQQIETNSRRKRNVVQQMRVRSVFAKRQYVTSAAVLYNMINKELDIYNMTYTKCKSAVTKWLKAKSYAEIELIIS
jgi:hypothetical protein